MSKANVHDIHYLQDIKHEYSHITIIGDKGYLSASVQVDLFKTSEIRLEVPYQLNQKDWKPTFPPFAKARKRVETLFSQMVDQFMLCHKYAKQQVSTTMTKEEFKRRWERNDRTNPITFDDIAKCAIEWGVCEKPRTRPLSRVRYEVLVAAGVSDAEEFNPDNYEED